MFSVRLGTSKEPLNETLATHRSLQTVLARFALSVPPCECERPRLALNVSDRWRDGKVEVVTVDSCCQERRTAYLARLPRSFLATTPHPSGRQVKYVA